MALVPPAWLALLLGAAAAGVLVALQAVAPAWGVEGGAASEWDVGGWIIYGTCRAQAEPMVHGRSVGHASLPYTWQAAASCLASGQAAHEFT
jgi:hypothetical protein